MSMRKTSAGSSPLKNASIPKQVGLAPKVHSKPLKRCFLRFRNSSLRDQLPIAVVSGVIACLVVIVAMSRRIDIVQDATAHSHLKHGRRPRLTDNAGRIRPEAVDVSTFYARRPRLVVANDLLKATALSSSSLQRYASSSLSKHVKPMSDIIYSEMSKKERRKLSKEYDDERKKDGVTPPCKHQYQWQTSSRPSCNKIHEGDWADRDSPHMPKRINHGGWVEIWKLHEFDGSPLVLKSKLYDVDWTQRNFDRYRRDAVCLERMSSSPLILDIYGYCGVTAIIPYCDKGDLDRAIEMRGDVFAPQKKVEIAHGVMSAIATVHNVDKRGQASIAHTDITADQFLNAGDDHFILNDFNRARFIGWNEEKDTSCGFEVGSNPGNWRSPEEYRYDLETEKIDVYSGGNILYKILTGLNPFEELSEKMAKRAVKEGKRPEISQHFRNSDDIATKVLIKAIEMAWTHDPEERPAAADIVRVIKRTLDTI